jgi:hypothetical protein
LLSTDSINGYDRKKEEKRKRQKKEERRIPIEGAEPIR